LRPPDPCHVQDRGRGTPWAARGVRAADGGRTAQGRYADKSHLLFAWLAEVVGRRSTLDAVEDLDGPGLPCWPANFFIKEAADPAFVSWHQDRAYWGLSKPDVVTAWVVFTAATAANGAMEYIPGSHQLDSIGYGGPMVTSKIPPTPAPGSGRRPARGQAPAGAYGTHGSRPAPRI
jgi:hypothetical protein